MIYIHSNSFQITGENDKYEFKKNDTLVVGFNNVLKNDLDLMFQRIR